MHHASGGAKGRREQRKERGGRETFLGRMLKVHAPEQGNPVSVGSKGSLL